jgi:hypothetical protein
VQDFGYERAFPGAAEGSSSDLPDSDRVEWAIKKLKSLHDGERGLIETAACGRRAIPALRALLFEREPSGLFQARCLAAKALAGLKAYDVLIEFLEAPRDSADPVERVGEDAVINAAARAVAALREPRVFDLLIRLAETGPLPGVTAALGAFSRIEAIPYLIEALAEDESRPEAEAALRNLGSSAHEALAVAACQPLPMPERESQSRLRQRRSALELLIETGVQARTWPVLRNLMQEQDAKIAVLACKICLMCAPEPEKREAIFRLISLLPSADFLLELAIEKCLAAYFNSAKELIAAAIRVVDSAPNDRTRRVLLNVKAHSQNDRVSDALPAGLT